MTRQPFECGRIGALASRRSEVLQFMVCLICHGFSTSVFAANTLRRKTETIIERIRATLHGIRHAFSGYVESIAGISESLMPLRERGNRPA